MVSNIDNKFVDASDGYASSLKGKGMIKFYHLPTKRNISFKAFITNFSDNYTSKWNEESVYGRMDPIPVFENTVRRIDLGFDVVAASVSEATSNLAKIDSFVQCLYPSYERVEEFYVLTTAPVWRIKFANLISRSNSGSSSAKSSGLVSYIGGFNFSPDFEPGVIISGDKIYPKVTKIELSLGILHEHVPGFVDTAGSTKFASGRHVFPYGEGSRNLVTTAKHSSKPPRRSKRKGPRP